MVKPLSQFIKWSRKLQGEIKQAISKGQTWQEFALDCLPHGKEAAIRYIEQFSDDEIIKALDEPFPRPSMQKMIGFSPLYAMALDVRIRFSIELEGNRIRDYIKGIDKVK